jgi:hypothetical protein
MLDRQDFLSYLTRAANASLGGAHVEGLIAPGTVKTRVLEAHPDEASSDGSATLLRQTAERLDMRVTQLGDELWSVAGDEIRIFVDTLNPRFWQLHSTNQAHRLQRVIKSALTADARLDSAWLPADLLKQLDGRHTYVRLAFDAHDLLGRDSTVQRSRVRFEGDAPEGLVELLKEDERYAGSTSITAMGGYVGEDGVGFAHLVADYRGAFTTARGDFEVAANAIWRMVDRYQDFVTALEDRYQPTATPIDECGLSLDGDVATFELPHEVDVERLVEGLFQAKEPFRMWAVPREVDNDEWVADAVDLHVGQPLRLEISPWHVRVLLEPDTCGNTLARLLTNLQQHLDARAELATA